MTPTHSPGKSALRWLDIPPVWLLAFILAAWALPRGGLAGAWVAPFGWVLVAQGVVLMAWAAWLFPRHRTSVVPHRKPDNIITSGPYRFSRNPIYLADALLLAGAALVMHSLLGLLLVPVFMVVITRRFIRGEEARLSAAFPDDAAAFFGRTRRWL